MQKNYEVHPRNAMQNDCEARRVGSEQGSIQEVSHIQAALNEQNTVLLQKCFRFGGTGVIWNFRSTFRPGNYIWSLSYGFGVVVRDLGEWRPGFYSEFRYDSNEHSGLAWGAILRKVLVLTLIPK